MARKKRKQNTNGRTIFSNRVWAMKLKPMAKYVLIGLLRYADKQGRCWPSIPAIATDTGVNEKTVRRQIQELKQMGILRVRHRRRNEKTGAWQSNMYTLHLPDLRAECPPAPEGTESGGARAQSTYGARAQSPPNYTNKNSTRGNRRARPFNPDRNPFKQEEK